MTQIQPELWVDRGATAVAFYQAAFGAKVVHRIGDGEDIVAQMVIGSAGFWVAAAGDSSTRLVPRAIGGATARMMLIVEDPDAVFTQAVGCGGTATSPVGDEGGWRVGRLHDPFGHEWEIAKAPDH